MGDARYQAPYDRLAGAGERASVLANMPDDEVIQALAHASRVSNPLLADVIAVEATNRMHRSRVIARAIGEGIIGFDANACINFVNPAAEEAIGVTAAALRGRPWDPLTVASRQDTGLIVARVVETGHASRRVEDTWSPSMLPVFDVEWRAYPIRRDEETTGAVLVFRDISEGVRQRRALAKERERLHAILENVTEAILLVDATGNFSFVNTAALQMLGIERETLFRSTLADRPWRMLAPDGAALEAEDYPSARSLREGKRIAGRYLIVRADGRRVPVILDAQPLFDEMRRVTGSVINFAKAQECPPTPGGAAPGAVPASK